MIRRFRGITLGSVSDSGPSHKGATAMSFGIYLVGYIILIAGLATGAYLLHLPPKWIGVGVLCMIGIAIIHGVAVTRHKDPA
jgi:hypothetical protein